MARGRMLARTASIDGRLAQLSDPALGLYLLTFPHLDRDGLCDGRAPVVWGQAAPLRAAWQPIACGLILEWLDAGLVTLYGTEREPVLWFRDFQRTQEGMRYEREEPSRFPPPPGLVRCPQHGLIAVNDAGEHADCKPRDQSQKARRDPANLGYSHQSPDLGRTKDGLSPGEDQEKLLLFDDELLSFSSRSGQKGGFGGKTSAGSQTCADVFAMLDTDGLWQIIDYLGEKTGIAAEHANWDGLCDGLDRDSQIELIEILGFLFLRADRITLKSPAAWVHASLRDHKPPNLRRPDLVELARLAGSLLNIENFAVFGL